MIKNWQKVGVTSFFLTVVGVSFYFIDFYYKVSATVFKISPEYVTSILQKKTSACKKIIDCSFVEGDILVRRYITKRTWLIDKFTKPFFTHSAMYLGSNKIVEAVGNEKITQDEIVISDLTTTDWYDAGVESWVIIRPKNISNKMAKIKGELENIASDPEYSFGIPIKNRKQLSCSDLVLNPLISNNVIKITSTPELITPDYIFWLGVNDTEDFEVFGYYINT